MKFVVTVASSSATLSNNPTTCPTPSGLAVGDLMVCQLVMMSDTDVATWATGWTLIEKKINTAHNPDGYSELRYKIAAAGDIGGTVTIITGYTVGGSSMAHLLRITGASSIGVITEASAVSTSATPSYANTITPGSGNEDSLLLFFTTMLANSITASGHAITTSNPSWTEQYDEANGAESVSLAYANRPQITATGNSSLTFSSSGDSIGQILAIRPARIISNSETQGTTDVATALRALLVSLSETQGTTDAVTTLLARAWTKVTKNVSSWLNDSKH